MEFRFRPRVEWLETREAPAIWAWDPQMGSADGGDAPNWLKDGVRSTTEIPDDNTDNVAFSNVNIA